MNAARGQTAIEYVCHACRAPSLVRVDVARPALKCYECRGWSKPTGRRVVLEAGGAIPVGWRDA